MVAPHTPDPGPRARREDGQAANATSWVNVDWGTESRGPVVGAREYGAKAVTGAHATVPCSSFSLVLCDTLALAWGADR